MWEGGEGGLRVPTSDPHTINACWSLFLLSTYLVVAEAASFDKKELCRSDTVPDWVDNADYDMSCCIYRPVRLNRLEERFYNLLP
jgi:hypothetical protein